MVVRPATDRDLGAIALMGARFLAASPYADFVQTEHADLVDRLRKLLADNGVAFVAEVDGEVRGAIVGRLSSLWFAASCVAIELGWWVDQDLRGGTVGVRLLWAFEDWARSQGATAVALSDLVSQGETPSGLLFERLGYRMVERAHVKEIV